MVNDVKKLNNVIEDLEKQASNVSEFHGILAAVKSAKDEIECAKSAVEKLTDMQKGFVSKNRRQIEGHRDRLTNIESQLATVSGVQRSIMKEIEGLEFVSPEQYQQGRTAIVKSFSEQMTLLAEQIKVNSERHRDDIRKLKILVFLIGLFLASGIILLLKGVFL